MPGSRLIGRSLSMTSIRPPPRQLDVDEKARCIQQQPSGFAKEHEQPTWSHLQTALPTEAGSQPETSATLELCMSTAGQASANEWAARRHAWALGHAGRPVRGFSESFLSFVVQVVTHRWFGCRRPRSSLGSGASRFAEDFGHTQAGEALEGGVGLLGALFG